MNQLFESLILSSTGASSSYEVETIQELWSGYGKILRMDLQGAPMSRIVVKHVAPPTKKTHPRGWNTNTSHKRKLRSYQVETAFYKEWSSLCDETCKIPHCYAIKTIGEEVLMVLEDLDDSGYYMRREQATWKEIQACIEWLANFHACFMQKKPSHLWKVGTYWHLATRPDELKVMADKALQQAAPLIDKALSSSPYQTFVHGDAKIANFCFGKQNKVAALDFQYVGGGCGMKDLVYFVGSCYYEKDCENFESRILNTYFSALRKSLVQRKSPIDLDALEANWRALYPVAWTDFHRFLKGWSPEHWKINSYSERLSKEVLKTL